MNGVAVEKCESKNANKAITVSYTDKLGNLRRVEQSDGKLPSILLHEKSGEIVDLNSTSAGRRWYFTYYFMKNTLESGDLFIIDEPAAMLHPLAQKEVLKELLQLESRGIKVIYSTHSPYLIPNDWKSVHFVAMTDVGREASEMFHSEATAFFDAFATV